MNYELMNYELMNAKTEIVRGRPFNTRGKGGGGGGQVCFFQKKSLFTKLAKRLVCSIECGKNIICSFICKKKIDC